MIHSFLMIGQSNMAGRGKPEEIPIIDNPHLKMLRNGRWQPMSVPVNPDRPFSGITLAESFADMYQKEHGVDVGLIPCADGGTQIEQWKEGSLLFDHAVNTTRLAERTSTLAGVLWHQGESDCTHDRYKLYAKRFKSFYIALSKQLHLEEIPFLIGGLGDFLQNREEESLYYKKFNSLLRTISAENPLMGFVSSEGLQGYPDHLHFTSTSLRELGIRYYGIYRLLEPPGRIFTEKPCEDDILRTALDSL